MSHCNIASVIVFRAPRGARCALIAAALLCTQAARADASAATGAPSTKSSVQPSAAAGRASPLSAEDAALVHELELVENAPLLRHLDLFEKPVPAAQRSPPATPSESPHK